MKTGSDFCRFLLPSIRNSALFCAALLLTVFAVSCVERPSPDQVTAAYFETVAGGDMLAMRPYLTPDGQEILDQMAAVPALRNAMESQRETQKQFWNGIVRTVSQPSIEGSRAVVVFTAEVPGRGRASCPIVLFLIDGQWKISSTSISGLQADRFRNELINLKAPSVEAAPSAPAKSAEAAPAAAKSAAAAPAAGTEKK